MEFGIGRHTEGCVRPDVRRQAAEVGRERLTLGGWGYSIMLKDPRRTSDSLYASQSSGWFGQVIQRSDDGGKTWAPMGNKFAYEG